MAESSWSDDELLLTPAERLTVMEECRVAGGYAGADDQGRAIRDVDGDRYHRRVGEVAALNRAVYGEDGARERVRLEEQTPLSDERDA